MSDGTGTASAVAEPATRSLEEALRREQKKVALVQEVSRALSEAGDLDSLLALIMSKVTELMEADRSTLYLLTDDNLTLCLKVVQGDVKVEIRLAGSVERSVPSAGPGPHRCRCDSDTTTGQTRGQAATDP